MRTYSAYITAMALNRPALLFYVNTYDSYQAEAEAVRRYRDMCDLDWKTYVAVVEHKQIVTQHVATITISSDFAEEKTYSYINAANYYEAELFAYEMYLEDMKLEMNTTVYVKEHISF